MTVNPDATDCPSRRWPTLLQLERYADTHLATTDGTVSHAGAAGSAGFDFSDDRARKSAEGLGDA